jgi:N-methylhydantoinase A
MLVAVPSREMSRTCSVLLGEANKSDLQSDFEELKQQALDDMDDELSDQAAKVFYSVDCRYQGQSFCLNMAWQDLDKIQQAFHQLHEQRYGHALDVPVELVTLRVSVQGQSSSFELPEIQTSDDKQGRHGYVQLVGVDGQVAVYQREEMCAGQKINGPVLIVEKTSTSYVAPDWQCTVDKHGSLLLKYKA